MEKRREAESEKGGRESCVCREGEGVGAATPLAAGIRKEGGGEEEGSRVREGGGSPVFVVKGGGRVCFAVIRGVSNDL